MSTAHRRRKIKPEYPTNTCIYLGSHVKNLVNDFMKQETAKNQKHPDFSIAKTSKRSS